MERSAIHLLAKRGKSQRQIAEELGRNRRTIARVLREPVEQRPAKRYRRSKVDPYRAQITAWLAAGLTAARMLELAREDAARPYQGGDNVFRSMVRRIRQEQQQQHAASDVPIRFEGLPGEYLQVDWGEVRRFPFARQAPATRYFLACRLKYSRWSWIRFTADMRQETLFRGLVDCCLALGWVPWVLVFDNMKTVTSGHTARFVTAQALAAQLGRTGTVVGRQRLLKPLLTCDVLVLDELGYLPTEPAFGPALYEVIAGRYERRPTILTANKSLTAWASIVQDVSLAAALVDRLMHHGQVFYLKGPSWRTRGQTVGQPPATEVAG